MYKSNVSSKIHVFFGIALINISIGLAIALAKSESFEAQNNDTKLVIIRTAIKLNNNADKLSRLSNKIVPNNQINTKVLDEISKDITKSQEELEMITEDSL